MHGRSLRRGVGLGFRSELAADLLAAPSAVDFLEVVAESCFAQRQLYREAVALSRRWPVLPHGVKLSLGSADGVDRARVRRLGQLARDVQAPAISEHVSFTRGGATEIGHLTQLPRTREAVRVLAKNVAAARRELPDLPLWLENVAFAFRWPEDEMDEATFYWEVVRATGCDLLLDVSNLYANARNEGADPSAVLAAYPLAHVAMLHVAGGVLEEGFYFDTHADPVPAQVFQLVREVLEVRPELPMMIERDANFASFAELTGELSTLRALRPTAARRPLGVALAHDLGGTERAPSLLARQHEVAQWLVQPAVPRGAAAEQIGLGDLQRARGILSRKRVDDALPLLPRLARHAGLRVLAEQVTQHAPRAPRGAGPADALLIARAACADPHLTDDARADELLLRARFSGPDAAGRVLPRRAPFWASTELSGGRRLRVRKGFGAFGVLRVDEKHG